VGGGRRRTAHVGSRGPRESNEHALGPTGEGCNLSAVLHQVASAARVESTAPERAVVTWPGPLAPEGQAWASPTIRRSSGICDVAAEPAARWDSTEVHVVNDLAAAGAPADSPWRTYLAIVNVGCDVGHKVFKGVRPVVGLSVSAGTNDGSRDRQLAALMKDRRRGLHRRDTRITRAADIAALNTIDDRSIMQIFTRLAAVLAGLALLTTACGGDGGTGSTASKRAAPNESAAASGAPTRSDADLVVWTDQPKVEAIQQIADGFAKENGISVDVQATTDTQASFVTANAAGNGPDVVVGAHDWIGNLVQNGAIEPLQLSAEQLSPYAHNAVEAVTYQEKLYGLPYGVEALVLYRNTALVPQTPATLDDAFKAGQAVVAAGKAESAFNLPVGEVGDAYHMQPLFTSAGGYVFGQTSTGDYNPKDLGLAKPEAVAAAKKIASIGEAGSKVLTRSVSADNSIALFTAGKAPFLLSGPWARPDIEKAGLKYAVQPVPGFAGGQQPKPFAGVQAFFVASKGKNRAFGQEFVSNAMNTPQAMQIMYERTKLPPTLTSLQQSAGAADPQLKAFLDAANSGEPMPAIPQMQAVFGPLSKAYSAIIGGADPTSTMQSTGKTVADAIS